MKKIINFVAVVIILGVSCLTFAMDMDTATDSRKRKAVAAPSQPIIKKRERITPVGKTFTCPECSMTFREKSNLTQHMRTHIGQKLCICNTCFKGFSSKRGLTKHKAIHKKKTFVCPECNRVFLSKQGLLKHNRAHHNQAPMQSHTAQSLSYNASSQSETLSPSAGIESIKTDSVSPLPQAQTSSSSATTELIMPVSSTVDVRLSFQDDWEFPRKDSIDMDIQ